MSYMALQKGMTIKEMMFDCILSSYKFLKSIGYPVKPYRKLDRKFFFQIIEGKCDLKLMVWKLLKEKVVEDEPLENTIFLKYKTYAELFTDFLAKEVVKIANKDTVIDIFKDVDLFRDEFEKLSKTMSSFASYKFLK